MPTGKTHGGRTPPALMDELEVGRRRQPPSLGPPPRDGAFAAPPADLCRRASTDRNVPATNDQPEEVTHDDDRICRRAPSYHLRHPRAPTTRTSTPALEAAVAEAKTLKLGRHATRNESIDGEWRDGAEQRPRSRSPTRFVTCSSGTFADRHDGGRRRG